MNDNSYMNDSGRSSMMTGFVVGALVGAGIALLLAPASGEDTRRRIGDTAKRLRDTAKDRVGQARETISTLREDARSAIETGRETFAQNRQRRGGTESPGTGNCSETAPGSRPL